jgi:hypothetical protein
MRRLSPLLFVIVLSTQLLAQSRNDELDASATDLMSNVATYCNTVEHHSNYSLPRVFARISSADDGSGWIEYRSSTAWIRAGRPQPMALVWYKGFKIVHVAITPNEASKPLVFADYCYREDGGLARLRSMPSLQRNCKGNRYQCSLVLRQERFYPPEGPALSTFGYLDGVGYVLNGATPSLGAIDEESLQPERMVVTFVPMKWPEYLHVADLPFSELL